MPTEKQIRDAIAATIQTAAPQAVVIPRNILGMKDDGWLGFLQSGVDSNRIHGWMVTLQSQAVIEDRVSAAEYELRFAVWQFLQYRTGSNSDNSEDAFSNERGAVLNAFAGALPAPLDGAKPLEFSLVDLFQVGDRLVHIAQGSIVVGTVLNCA
jgi:hypothetical protein